MQKKSLFYVKISVFLSCHTKIRVLASVQICSDFGPCLFALIDEVLKWKTNVSGRREIPAAVRLPCYIGQLFYLTKYFGFTFFSLQLWLSGFWPRGSSEIMKQTQVKFLSRSVWKNNNAIDLCAPSLPFIHPSTCNLSVPAGALYSRKVTLDGEEVSLQIQDTPCVALQVSAENTEAAADVYGEKRTN